MYEGFHGLKEAPFSNAADLRFYCAGPEHGRAWAAMLGGVKTATAAIVERTARDLRPAD